MAFCKEHFSSVDADIIDRCERYNWTFTFGSHTIKKQYDALSEWARRYVINRVVMDQETVYSWMAGQRPYKDLRESFSLESLHEVFVEYWWLFDYCDEVSVIDVHGRNHAGSRDATLRLRNEKKFCTRVLLKIGSESESSSQDDENTESVNVKCFACIQCNGENAARAAEAVTKKENVSGKKKGRLILFGCEKRYPKEHSLLLLMLAADFLLAFDKEDRRRRSPAVEDEEPAELLIVRLTTVADDVVMADAKRQNKTFNAYLDSCDFSQERSEPMDDEPPEEETDPKNGRSTYGTSLYGVIQRINFEGYDVEFFRPKAVPLLLQDVYAVIFPKYSRTTYSPERVCKGVMVSEADHSDSSTSSVSSVSSNGLWSLTEIAVNVPDDSEEGKSGGGKMGRERKTRRKIWRRHMNLVDVAPNLIDNKTILSRLQKLYNPDKPTVGLAKASYDISVVSLVECFRRAARELEMVSP